MNTTKPLLLLVTGMPSSGKTTLAHALADALHLPLV
jgi:adenylylsulfate kinase-like enzyme